VRRAERAQRASHRPEAFTLIELLVVMALMMVIATLGYMAFDSLQTNRTRTGAVDRVSGWLLYAKQRAKRDMLPTGVRLIVPPSTDPAFVGANLATQLQFVQQPDNYTGGTCQSIDATTKTATFTGVDFIGTDPSAPKDQWAVQAGDYLEVYGGGGVRRITDVPSATTLTLQNAPDQAVNAPGTGNYRILRQPRPIVGEEVLTLPQDMVVDLNSGRSQGVPTRTTPTGTVNEIVFATTGAVTGVGTGVGQIFLWVRDNTVASPTAEGSAIVAVQVRTGFIAAHPVDPGADPYFFAKDARSSGM